MQKLSEQEIKSGLANINGWQFTKGSIEKSFSFSTFIEAFGFMAKAALVAEKMNHHPDWRNVYNRVEIRLNTHDVGGITEQDFELAAQIDKLSKS